jgi:hypothetical protein
LGGATAFFSSALASACSAFSSFALVELDCDLFQGYLFFRPTPVGELPGLIERAPVRALDRGAPGLGR